MSRIAYATTIANSSRRSRSAKADSGAPLPPVNYASTALSPQTREDITRRLRSEGVRYDMVVIGAGVTGAGVALDAASRGLSVLLVDRNDLAFGTSRWSSKLAHGGLRYLASGNVGIARRSAMERGILMETTAPHLTRALPQVVPVMRKFSLANRFLPRVGFLAGDLLRVAAGTSARTLPWSRTVSAKRVAELCPAVSREETQWGYVNFDGQLIDDARLVTTLARTASGYGADVLNHADVTAVDSRSGLVHLRIDTNGTDTHEVAVRASAIVNATGVWAETFCPQVSVKPSRGTHLVVDAAKLGNPTGALTVPVPGATNRFCFILPVQLGRCYVGLTDEPAARIEEIPDAPSADVDWILDVVNQALNTSLNRSDVIGSFAGLRPLVEFSRTGRHSDANTPTADLSREHLILREGRTLTVTGGKLTEYRLMAEQTVDAAVEAGLVRPLGGCVTKKTPLVGAFPLRDGQGPDNETPADLSAGHGAHSVGKDGLLPESLIERFGQEASVVVKTSTLPRPLDLVAPGLDVTRAEIAFAVTHEGARSVSDILDRRTRLGLVEADRAKAVPTAEEALRAAGITPGRGA